MFTFHWTAWFIFAVLGQWHQVFFSIAFRSITSKMVSDITTQKSFHSYLTAFEMLGNAIGLLLGGMYVTLWYNTLNFWVNVAVALIPTFAFVKMHLLDNMLSLDNPAVELMLKHT